MTPRQRCRTHAAVLYAAVATGIAEVAAGAVARLTAYSVDSAIAVFLTAWAVVTVAAVWPGRRLLDALSRVCTCGESTLPPPGGMIDGPAGPPSERLTT